MTSPCKLMLLVTLALMAACRSEPIQFHTLMPTQVSRSPAGSEIAIESVSVPAQVDRAQIVVRQGASGLAILETQWWGASLADELRSALAEQLSSGVPGQQRSVRIIVQRFDSVPGQYALLDTKWRLRVAAGASLDCRSVVQSPAGASIDAVVTAHQRNLMRLASLINQTARNPQAGCAASPSLGPGV
ncbi:PqiC family protein [Pseudomonas sp. S07E 245]|uniref:PqiC family protein n=1 Tax=Pseudomonas sp. S07E 245 TaxID=2866278 RepID=UPI001C731EEF|nr:PqiC family protein [Pseudomonas sp. S07E 245]QYX54290.1 PqiC family protein [Pseudomonas sp. S07E 245]